MIDALVPASKALLAGALRAAEIARAGTAKMDRAGAGRSSYLSSLADRCN